MTRQIKFRAWDKKYKAWIKGFAIWTNGVISDDGEKVFMQYTGLKDKNGKEIYEGDIVKDTDDGKIGDVSWNNTWMKWDVGAEGYWADDSAYCDNYMEIIGNIYENPELLK